MVLGNVNFYNECYDVIIVFIYSEISPEFTSIFINKVNLL